MFRRSMSDSEHRRVALVYCSRRPPAKPIMTLVDTCCKQTRGADGAGIAGAEDPSKLRFVPQAKADALEERHGDLDSLRDRFRDSGTQPHSATTASASLGLKSGMMEQPTNRCAPFETSIDQDRESRLMLAWDAVDRYDEACAALRGCLSYSAAGESRRALALVVGEPLLHPTNRQPLRTEPKWTAADWVLGVGQLGRRGETRVWVASGMEMEWPRGASVLDDAPPKYRRTALGTQGGFCTGSGAAAGSSGSSRRGGVELSRDGHDTESMEAPPPVSGIHPHADRME